MAIQSKAYLYGQFETNDTPTQQDFRDVFDTMIDGASGRWRTWTQEILGTGNGLASAFPFTNAPASSSTTFLYVNGVFQNITIDWNLVNNQAVFTAIIPPGWVIASVYSYIV